MARIKVIQHEEAEGELLDIYDDLVLKRGKLAEVHKIQSLRPASILKHMDLYMEIMYTKSELSRAYREMIATVVSATNGCEYCQIHHGEALNKYWKDEAKVLKLRKLKFEDILSKKEFALCSFAKHLTLNPEQHEKENYTQQLKEVGFSDSAILDTVLVTAYFNFVNRIVLSLSVEVEDDNAKGYKY